MSEQIIADLSGIKMPDGCAGCPHADISEFARRFDCTIFEDADQAHKMPGGCWGKRRKNSDEPKD